MPPTLQSSTKSTQVINIQAQPPGMLGQVQFSSNTQQQNDIGPSLVVSLEQTNSSDTCMSPSTSSCDRVRCLTTWVGSMMHEGQHGGTLVCGRINPSHQLSGVTGGFSSSQKGLIILKMDNISAVTYINQKGGTYSTQLSNLALEVWE